MQTRSLFISLLTIAGSTLTVSCTTVYTVASTATWAATGRSIPEWTASTATGGNCEVKQVFDDKYLCEMPVVYNRSGF